MKILLLLSLVCFLPPVFGATLSLPLGGKVEIDDREWNVQDFSLKGTKVVTLVHKKHHDLQGFVLGGQIRESGPCKAKLSDDKWAFCQKTSREGAIVNEQVLAQRKVSARSFQNYMFTFNVPTAKEKDYATLIANFRKKLGSTP